MNKNKRFLKFLIIAIACFLAAAWLVMLLWNWLLPTLFNMPFISYLQALAILILCKLLFGGWRGGSNKRSCYTPTSNQEKQMAGMSDEEREKFKQQFYNRCKDKWGCDMPDDNA
ncbi:MAG: hypothetical protein JNK61_01850 [Bacteroidia bacterium]|nr:hypothetical protein [Bacteroidia bacterium]